MMDNGPRSMPRDNPGPCSKAPIARQQPAPPRLECLPPYRVLLHNDDVNDMQYVVDTLCELTPLPLPQATRVMLEAHTTGVALVLVTHRERAELYVDQFRSRGLTVSIEPAS